MTNDEAGPQPSVPEPPSTPSADELERARVREQQSPDDSQADPFVAIHPHPGKPTTWPPSAHERGLSSPYPPGGQDPEPETGRREERFYLQLLVAMVLLIVLGGFALGIVGILLGIGGADGVH